MNTNSMGVSNRNSGDMWQNITLPDILNHFEVSRGSKRFRSTENTDTAFSKRQKLMENFPVLFGDQWRQILHLSLGKPEGECFEILSVVCQLWRDQCDRIKEQLVNEGVSLQRIFRCFSLEGANCGRFPLLETPFFQAYGTKLQRLDLSCSDRISDVGFLEAVNSFQNLRELIIEDCYFITFDAVRVVSQLTNLETLHLPSVQDFGGREFEIVSPLLQLSDLRVGVDNVGDEEFASIEHLSKLRSLELSGEGPFSETKLKSLAKLTNLIDLELFVSRLTPNGDLQPIIPLTQLQKLTCDAIDNISIAGLRVIASFVQLQYLDLSRSDITDTGLGEIVSLTNLQTLRLDECSNITDFGGCFIIALQKLQELSMQHCHQVTDITVQLMSGILPDRDLKSQSIVYLVLSQLQHLNLNDCPLTDNITAAISQFTGLQSLRIRGSQVSSVFSKAISASLEQLRYLDLTQCEHIKDEDALYLSKITQLRTLKLSCNPITDIGLYWLADLVRLKSFTIAHCNRVTDYGLGWIAMLTELQILEIYHCEQITETGIEALSWPSHLKIDFRA